MLADRFATVTSGFDAVVSMEGETVAALAVHIAEQLIDAERSCGLSQAARIRISDLVL